MDVFNLVAGIASILGLGASLWAVAEVRRLRRRYQRMTFLPDRISQLEGHARELTRLAESAPAEPGGMADEVARLEATLDDLYQLLERSNKRAVRLVQRHVRHRRPVEHREQVRSIRTEVIRLIGLLQRNAEEDPWA